MMSSGSVVAELQVAVSRFRKSSAGSGNGCASKGSGSSGSGFKNLVEAPTSGYQIAINRSLLVS